LYKFELNAEAYAKVRILCCANEPKLDWSYVR
jgi:hypothetical protein